MSTAPVLTFFAYLSSAMTLTAADCATCHPSQAQLHSQSAHASALMAPAGSRFVRDLLDKALGEAADGYLFEYSQTPEGVNAIVQRVPIA